MIRVEPRPAPLDFDERVRIPGLRALAELQGDDEALARLPSRPGPRRTKLGALSAGRLPPYWTECLADLHAAYGGICAYLAIYIPPAVGARTVDHFDAKSWACAHASTSLEQTYEWHDYRLACSLMNSRKSRASDVLDPFQIEDGWFHLELSALQVVPNPTLTSDRRQQVQQTINRLGLNDHECTAARAEYHDAYIQGEINLSFLSRRSPFVAFELKRQGMLRPETMG